MTGDHGRGRRRFPPPGPCDSAARPYRQNRSAVRGTPAGGTESTMGAYIVRRVIAMILMLIALSMIVFLLFEALPATPPDSPAARRARPQVIEANRVRLGLDKPLYEQYGAFVKGIFAGRTYGSGTATFECARPCLGYSFDRGEEVTDLVSHAFPVTLQLALGAFVLWIIVGVTVGIIAALRRGKWQDRPIMGFALIGYSFPSFFIGLLLIFFVQIRWGLVGLRGLRPVLRRPDRLVQGAASCPGSPWRCSTRPSTRGSPATRCSRPWARTTSAPPAPRASRERTVIGKHGLRAGLTPIVTAAGLDLAGLLGGAVITEAVFNLPGLGRLSIDSVLALRPAGHHGDRAARRHLRHRGEPRRRHPVRRHRPESEAQRDRTTGVPRRQGPPGLSSRPRTASSAPSTASTSRSRRARRWRSSASPGPASR